jgi:hypothetical protein
MTRSGIFRSSERMVRGAVAPDSIEAPPHGALGDFRSKLAVYRALRAIPDNEEVSFRAVLDPMFRRALEQLPLIGERIRRRRGLLFEDDMRLLNDALADSPLGGRYWIWGGLLLGWAREGRVLPHDVGDADFAFSRDDEALLIAAEPQLRAAGFRRWFSFRNCRGERTEHVFVRHGFRFEFFCMDEVDADTHEYYVYGQAAFEPVELVGHLPRQALEAFEFLGRTWRKPLDHELLLRTCYGNWRIPDPGWSMFDDGSLVARRAWRPTSGPRVG